MTREEAKAWLNKLYARADITDEYGDMEDMQPYEEALRMAIKALEIEPSGDLIRRQAVIDILKDKWNIFSDANDAIQESIDTIEALRPVIAKPKTGYISIDDVMSVFDDFMCGKVDENETETFLEMLKDKLSESEDV